MEPIMDEAAALKYIFKDDVSFSCSNDRAMYKICIDEKYLEFECDGNYPDTVPEVFSNVDKEAIDRVRKESTRFISTPMIFDMVRLIIRRLEEVDIEKSRNEGISISYSVSEGEKITEEDFLNWKVKNAKARITSSGTTGKEIFLERRSSMTKMFECRIMSEQHSAHS